MVWSVVIGRKALAEAFDALVLVATTLDTAGASLKNVNVPIFSYVLTNKQFDAIKKICKQEGVPEPVHRGVLIDLNAVLHPIQARIDKDGCDALFTAEVLKAAYSDMSSIAINKTHTGQAIVFNAGKTLERKGQKFYALAIVKAGGKQIAPITAYHATEAKIRSIKKG